VKGFAEVDNKVYLIFLYSSNIEVCDAQTFKQLTVIKVKGLKDPCDIMACRDDRQLYVAELDCLWRVSTIDGQQYKWLTTKSKTDTFRVNKLSLTSRNLLVTSSQPPALRQYSTVDAQLLREVQLPQFVSELYHGVETSRGTFVVGHWGTSQYKQQWAVSIRCFLLSCIQWHH